MSQNKKFFLNGQTYYTEHDINLFDIVTYFNYNNSFFVLEYNNFICGKKKWKNILVQNQDKVEIVTIVGGG